MRNWLRGPTGDEFVEPDVNTYILTIELSNIKKAKALQIAEALGSICDHEGVSATEIIVAHVKYFA